MSLRFVRTIALGGLLILSVALVYALSAGHFRADGLALVKNPWGLATLVDAYVGFALISCWIVWREARLGKALIWTAMIFAGGNLVSAIYVLNALRGSKGNVAAFWLGARRDALLRPVAVEDRN